MIFVTLGTQDKDFSRLLSAIDKQIDKGNIKEKVIVQAGYTKYKSKNMEIYELLNKKDFENYINKCDLVITHGGVGSIMDSLKREKKVIGAARLKEYNEHTNNHQLEIIETFSKIGYILKLEDFDKLDEVLREAKKFKPKKIDNKDYKMLDIIENYIDEKGKKEVNIYTVILLLILILILILIIV